MNKKEKIFLIIGITAVASVFILLAIDDWMVDFAVITGVFLFSVLIVDPLDSRTKNENEIREKEEDEFGSEVMAAVDSRIYERPSFFLGVPFIFVFGGIWSKYESVFSIEHEGQTVVVLYHGLCLVSAEDRLLIRGKWYRGKQVGIQGNVVVANRVENVSSGIVFEKA
ncbi:hypothetical protein [Methanosarcina lacustris]|uniref:hypothetical protein n=1 Tax=Methanosarcina lacustris TaxID=170861 RepID=UPI001E56D40E|nr:hypothetical protein [Methanosarcina lacustris]